MRNYSTVVVAPCAPLPRRLRCCTLGLSRVSVPAACLIPSANRCAGNTDRPGRGGRWRGVAGVVGEGASGISGLTDRLQTDYRTAGGVCDATSIGLVLFPCVVSVRSSALGPFCRTRAPSQQVNVKESALPGPYSSLSPLTASQLQPNTRTFDQGTECCPRILCSRGPQIFRVCRDAGFAKELRCCVLVLSCTVLYFHWILTAPWATAALLCPTPGLC